MTSSDNSIKKEARPLQTIIHNYKCYMLMQLAMPESSHANDDCKCHKKLEVSNS